MDGNFEWQANWNGGHNKRPHFAPMTLLGPWAFSPLSGPYDGFVSFSRHPMRGRVETPGRRAWLGVVWGCLGCFGLVWGGSRWFGVVWDGLGWFGVVWGGLGWLEWFGVVCGGFGVVWDGFNNTFRRVLLKTSFKRARPRVLDTGAF